MNSSRRLARSVNQLPIFSCTADLVPRHMLAVTTYLLSLGGLGVVEVRTVLGRITELPAFRRHGLPLYPNIRPTMMTTY